MVILATEWAPLSLRVILGIIFLVHGYPKLFKNFRGTADWLASSGFKPGVFWAFVLGATEFFGGWALLLGLVSRVAAGLLIISMVIATLLKSLKWHAPFTTDTGSGYEFDLLILAGLVALFLLGSGMWSFDQMFGWVLG